MQRYQALAEQLGRWPTNREKQCMNKHRHTGASAQAEAARLNLIQPTTPVAPYVCDVCGGWHVGRLKQGRHHATQTHDYDTYARRTPGAC